ncbi:hypothetical protein Dsin_012922 [Dipteronia sinensis]|uniref:Uncharacterized protein n=1 Tax=Dipteronia sinensis TaxID=43782 RepID=A0AAE0AKA4_9ROSI|nr:hypothetical protein Dsin_012922 [Dipteronia sinensis]
MEVAIGDQRTSICVDHHMCKDGGHDLHLSVDKGRRPLSLRKWRLRDVPMEFHGDGNPPMDPYQFYGLYLREVGGRVSEHNLTGYVVQYPYIEFRSGATIKNFINNLMKTRKFQGLKYTYWDNLIATNHMDFVVKHNVEFILENLNLPQLEPQEIVDKFVAAQLLQAKHPFLAF